MQQRMQHKKQLNVNDQHNTLNDRHNSNSFYFKSSNSLYFKNSTMNDPLYDYTNYPSPNTPTKHNTSPAETLSTLQLTPIDLNSPKQIQIENFEKTYLDR